MQEPGDLPGDLPVVHLHGRSRPPGPGPRGDQARSAGSRPGARSGSPAWWPPGPTGASPASGPGACPFRRSTAGPAARSWPPRPSTRHVADIFGREGSNAWFVRNAPRPAAARHDAARSAARRTSKRKTTSSTSGSNRAPATASSASGRTFPGRPTSISRATTSTAAGSTARFSSASAPGRLALPDLHHPRLRPGRAGEGDVEIARQRHRTRDIISQNGAEILRLWVAMLNFKEDARLRRRVLERLVDAYRKVRNTWRFLLGNLYDFAPDTRRSRQRRT